MPTNKLLPHQDAAVKDGYPFECTCGEMFKSATAAWTCKKCRIYLTDSDFEGREVIDLRDGSKAPRFF